MPEAPLLWICGVPTQKAKDAFWFCFSGLTRGCSSQEVTCDGESPTELNVDVEKLRQRVARPEKKVYLFIQPTANLPKNWFWFSTQNLSSITSFLRFVRIFVSSFHLSRIPNFEMMPWFLLSWTGNMCQLWSCWRSMASKANVKNMTGQKESN